MFLLVLVAILVGIALMPIPTIIPNIPGPISSRIPEPIPRYPLIPPRVELEPNKPIPIPEIPREFVLPEVLPEMPPLQDLYNPLPINMSFDEPIDYQRPSENVITDIGDLLLLPPELVLDLLVGTVDQLLGVRDPASSVTARLFDFHAAPARSHLFSVLMENLTKREMRYFGGFGDSYLNTPEVEMGLAQVQADDLLTDQRKILWDVGKNTYLSKYRLKVDTIREEAFYFTDWRGIDFAVLPPLVGGYLYYRGLDKKIGFLGTEVKISIEPIQRWVDHNDLLIGFGIECAPKDWPVKLIAAVGLEDNDIELQFIGIGTSINTVKQLIFRHTESR